MKYFLVTLFSFSLMAQNHLHGRKSEGVGGGNGGSPILENVDSLRLELEENYFKPLHLAYEDLGLILIKIANEPLVDEKGIPALLIYSEKENVIWVSHQWFDVKNENARKEKIKRVYDQIFTLKGLK